MASLIFLSYIFLSGARNDDRRPPKNQTATNEYFQPLSHCVVTCLRFKRYARSSPALWDGTM